MSEKEPNESRFWVVSFQTKTGRVAPREEERGNFEVALGEEEMRMRNKIREGRKRT
jgi:hypothetical protein